MRKPSRSERISSKIATLRTSFCGETSVQDSLFPLSISLWLGGPCRGDYNNESLETPHEYVVRAFRSTTRLTSTPDPMMVVKRNLQTKCCALFNLRKNLQCATNLQRSLTHARQPISVTFDFGIAAAPIVIHS